MDLDKKDFVFEGYLIGMTEGEATRFLDKLKLLRVVYMRDCGDAPVSPAVEHARINLTIVNGLVDHYFIEAA